MRKIATLLFMGIMLMPATALAGQEVCPNEGKVESVVDGDLDGIVLAAGTLVCIKAGTTVVYVTADGEQTLAELIGNNKNVSHYTVISTPPTTTTTTVPPTTTTVPPTTTTVPRTTTTVPETTTTVPETTTTDPVTTTTDPVTTTTDPETVVTTVPSELPKTGVNASALILTGLVLMSGGLLLLGVKNRFE